MSENLKSVLYFLSGIHIICLKWKLPEQPLNSIVRYFSIVLSLLAQWKLWKLKLVKNTNFIKAILPEGREKNQKLKIFKHILVEAETGYTLSAWW